MPNVGTVCDICGNTVGENGEGRYCEACIHDDAIQWCVPCGRHPAMGGRDCCEACYSAKLEGLVADVAKMPADSHPIMLSFRHRAQELLK